MKNWIPSLIRNQNQAVLIFKDNLYPKTIPITYTNRSGHLIFPLSILNTSIISSLERHREVSVFIKSETKSLLLQGSSTILKDSINRKSELLETYFDQYYSSIPLLQKTIWIDFTPQVIVASTEGELSETIELEIL